MIYELRAYIGKTKTLYSAIFTTMEAAKSDSVKLLNLFRKNGESIYGYITPLTATPKRNDFNTPIGHPERITTA